MAILQGPDWVLFYCNDHRDSLDQRQRWFAIKNRKRTFSKPLYSKFASFVYMGAKSFYRYQSLKEEYDRDYNCKNYTLRSLAQNQLYFSDPDNFNDPFDCRILVDFTGTEDQWIEYLCTQEGCTPEKAREEVSKFRKNKDCLVFPSKESANLKGARICCFSDENNDILMWSHYADSHRGICLCFEGSGENGKYSMPLYKSNTDESPYSGQFEKVYYNSNNDLCVVSIFENPHKNVNMVEDRILTKLYMWQYENEYRMKVPEFHIHKQELFKYFKGCLKGIIFGLKTNKQDIIRVYNIINENYIKDGHNVTFCEAKEVPRKYGIQIVPINNIEEYIKNKE